MWNIWFTIVKSVRAWKNPERWLFIFSATWTGIVNRLQGNAVIQKIEKDSLSILIVKLDEIGDMVYALPTIRQIYVQHPNADVTLWCKKISSGICKHEFLNMRTVFENEIPKGNYDIEVELRGSFKSLWRSMLHPPKLRLDRGSIRMQNKMKATPMHDWQINAVVARPLLRAQIPFEFKIITSPKEQEHVTNYLAHWGITQFAVLHIGARSALRRWPTQNFAALARYLHQQHGLHIVVVGDQNDKHLIEYFRHTVMPTPWHACALFSLTELSVLCSKAAVFVGNESGPLHIAAASGCPTLGLFGPGEPDVFYPTGMSTEMNAEILHVVLPCNPCNQKDCAFPQNPCIQRIGVNEAIAAVDRLLAKKNRD